MSVNDYDEVLYAKMQDLELDNSIEYGIAMQRVHQEYDSLSLSRGPLRWCRDHPTPRDGIAP